MIEHATPEPHAAAVPAVKACRRPARAGLRRRSAVLVVVISGFIILTVWLLRYAGEVGDAFRAAAEEGRSRPWGQVFNPRFIAQTCPKPLMLLLTTIVGFFLYLRRKSLRPLERLILDALNGTNPARESGSRPLPPSNQCK